MRHKLLQLFILALACVYSTAQDASQEGTAGDEKPSPPVPAPSLTSGEMDDGMRQILMKVGSVPCSESVRSKIYLLLFGNNRELHDQCLSDCGYQFFPASKQKATTDQIVAAASSKACVALFSGVILADFPECDVDYVSTRSCAEVLLRIKTDIDEKLTPPTQQQFFEFYNLNRVINLLNENATLIEAAFENSTTQISVWEITKMMNSIYVSPDVMLHDDMTILVRDEGSTWSDRTPGWQPANVMLATKRTSGDGSSGPSDIAASSGGTTSGSNQPSKSTVPSDSAVNETTRSRGTTTPKEPSMVGLVVAVTALVVLRGN